MLIHGCFQADVGWHFSGEYGQFAKQPEISPQEALKRFRDGLPARHHNRGNAVRCLKMLSRSGITTWEALMHCEPEVFSHARNFGITAHKTLSEVASLHGRNIPDLVKK